MGDWGVYLDGNSVVSDTCLSLQEYLQNPVNTTLNTMLPCAALATANATYRETRIDIDGVIRTVHSLNPKNHHFPTYWSFLSPSFSLLKNLAFDFATETVCSLHIWAKIPTR